MRKDCQMSVRETSAYQNQNITSQAITMLDSHNASVSAPGATTEPRFDEGVLIVSSDENSEWYFLMLRSKEIRRFNDLLTGVTTLSVKEDNIIKKYRFRFKTFIYTAAGHRRRIEECLYSEEEYQRRMESAVQAMKTIDDDSNQNISDETNVGGGYLFVYAPVQKLKKALEMIIPRRSLVMDMGTRKAARVPDEQMRNFVFLYETVPWNVQFMQRPICDYAANRERVRITGGALKGAEGYIVRIHRDRSLVFSFGNMTLAVGGIHSYPFEIVK